MPFLFHSNIDPCKASKPCKNNATCANNNGDYRCTCKPGYQGKNCEQGDSYSVVNRYLGNGCFYVGWMKLF